MDPKTGLRIDKEKFTPVAINCEASTMIYHDGYYYLMATHGSCCQGANSGYRIVTGRSKSPTGPFVDNEGFDMMKAVANFSRVQADVLLVQVTLVLLMKVTAYRNSPCTGKQTLIEAAQVFWIFFQ